MLRTSKQAHAKKNRRRNQGRFISTLEQLEGRALLASLYVNAANLTGIEDGSLTHPYSQIQTAINNTAPSGDTVHVAPGVYAEALNVNHSIELLGPNAGINPNSGTRNSEAILLPPSNNPDAGIVVLVTANNVTIDGLFIDGHNPNLPTGTLLNGISANAGSGIANVDNHGHLNFISGLNVLNNVIQNFTLFGVLADANDFSKDPLDVSTGNAIRNNKIDNVPLVSPLPARGISIEHNFYADVTGNVITRAGTGIQAIFMLNPNPTGAISSISGNEVHAYNLGIYLWTIDSETPVFNVANNSVFAQAGPYATPTNVGIELRRVLSTTGVSLSNNNSTGNHVGIKLQYTTASPITTVTGGTLSGNDYGVLITNSDAITGSTPRNVRGNLVGVTIQNANNAAIYVEDAIANPAASVTLNVDPTTTLNGNARGVLLTGPNAKIVEAVKPTLALTLTPPASTSDTTAAFGFSLADNLSSSGDLLVQYRLDGGSLLNATSPFSLSGLTVGSHSVLLRVTDQAGNVQETSYQWDVTAPPPTTTPTPAKPALDLASDTGVSNSDGITNDNTPAFFGTAAAGSTVTLFAGTTPLGMATADAFGHWEFTVGGPGSLMASLANGTYAITVTAKNPAEAISLPSASLAIVIDNANPAATFTSTPQALTSATTASFAFNVVDNASASGQLLVQYSLDGGAFVNATSPVNLSGLSLGTHSILLKVTDQAGNEGTTAYEWTITPPLQTTLYVDASNTSGIEDGSQSYPYRRIQTAIDHATTTIDTVMVAAGVYAEAINVNHSIKLLGPNAGINPNSAARGPEAILLPADNNPHAGIVVLVTANNVTIDGLFIDGHNPNLPTGTLLNGISSNSGSGIANVDNLGHLNFISGLNVLNNVIQNFTLFGVLADANDFSKDPLDVSTGNAIRNNKIDNVPLVSPLPARGISIEHNFYADVTGNVITRAGTGIQAIFMLNPNPTGAISSISGNEVHAYNLGIYLWTIDSETPVFNVANNSVFAQAGPYATPTNVGIELRRVLSTTGVSLSNNNSTGNHVGIKLQYTTASPITTVTGGTLSGNDYGVLITNSDAITGSTPRNVRGNLVGVTIQNSNNAAIYVEDAIANPAASVTLNVDPTTTLNGNARGVLLTGPNARIVEAVKPTLALTLTPPASTSDTTAAFGFSLADNLSSSGDLLVQYRLDGGSLLNATSPFSLSGLTVGSHSVLLRVTDQAGNVQETSYQWDVTAPPPIITPTPAKPALDLDSDTGVSSSDGITRDNTPAFFGTATAGSTVALFAGSTLLGTTVANSAGLWGFAVGGPGSLVASLANGSFAITVTAKSATGETSQPSAPLAILIDNANPTASFTSAPPAETTSTSASFTFNVADNSSASGNLRIQYSLDGGAFVNATSPLTLNGLALGTHSLLLNVTDQAGNVGTAFSQWTIVSPPPTPTPTPARPSLDAASDTGSSSTDGLTKDNTPTFRGNAVAGSVVTLFAGTTPLGTTVANSSGSWSFTVGQAGSFVASLPDGTHAITVTAKTANGATSQPSAARAILIDTTAPVLQVARSPLPNGQGWNNTNVVASYTASDNGSGLNSAATGSYTFSSQGSGQSRTFTVNDRAGNTSSVTVGAVAIDKTVPTVTVTASPNNLKPANNRTVQVLVTGKVTDTLSGVGTTASYTVRDSYGLISINGTLTLGAGGSYSFTVPLPATVKGLSSPRTFTISVTGVDAASNTKTQSTTVQVPTTGYQSMITALKVGKHTRLARLRAQLRNLRGI
ncbi:Ig-like domain-containing protein [Singulisphaera sp. Ch08]|uniref:Ig-like domain-containing protein n=1 Tax=Singulisphaera sp. Ch08 TaxID=3120278 RepID=A0AAU7CAH7_9BACT